MEVQLYNRNLSSPTLDTDLTFDIQRLKFSTKLNGGFNICSFSLKAGLPKAWEWITDKVFYRLIITDNQKTLWEGRIQDIGIEAGLVVVTGYGYFASMNDQVEATPYTVDADVAIKKFLTDHAPMINADQTHIDATNGPEIKSTASADFIHKSVRVLTEKLTDFGDDAGDQWYFAIWEDRIPYFFQRSISTVDWAVNLSDLSRFKLKHSSKDLWNRTACLYDGTSITVDQDDTTSQDKYGLVRSYTIPDIGTFGDGGTAALAKAKKWLAEHKDIWPTLEDIVLGDNVFDTNGVPYPSSWVRAGDVIRVLDLVPVSGDLDAVTRDALRTFYILETGYNADNLTNRIVVDTDKRDLTSIIAKVI